jgi:hypothetical protein
MKQPVSFKWMLLATFMLASYTNRLNAQAVLNADGPGNTYELINSVLAPGYAAVENPECVHPSFGRHIAEVFDTDLHQYVFEFYSHVAEDNDRCINFDRERVEIKTYDQSPDTLIGTIGETITYKWKFRLPVGFKPSSSFTHIHQVKAVGGDEGDPLFTLTPRKGTPNKMELIYVLDSNASSNKLKIVNLSLFEGVWVEVTEVVKVGANGAYSIDIKKVSDGSSILSYTNASIATIRPSNTFIRPKWGIYRSLNSPADLRDDTIRFSGISIDEHLSIVPLQLLFFKTALFGKAVLVNWSTASENGTQHFIVERSDNGIVFLPLKTMPAAGFSNKDIQYHYIDEHPLKGTNYYRLKQTNNNGTFSYSKVAVLEFKEELSSALLVYPNPVKDKMQILIAGINGMVRSSITTQEGKNIFFASGSISDVNNEINQQLVFFNRGMYFLKINNGKEYYTAKFLKQ